MRQREHASPRPAGSLADSAHATDSPQPVASLASSSAGGGSGPLAATALGTGADLAVALKGRLAHLKALHGGGSSSGGSCGSADDSAAALAGLHATGRTAVGGQGGSGKCSTCDDSAGACGDAALDLDGSAWYEDDEGDPYGADTLRPPWRRHEVSWRAGGSDCLGAGAGRWPRFVPPSLTVWNRQACNGLPLCRPA